jgi:hypothetical protein
MWTLCALLIIFVLKFNFIDKLFSDFGVTSLGIEVL